MYKNDNIIIFIFLIKQMSEERILNYEKDIYGLIISIDSIGDMLQKIHMEKIIVSIEDIGEGHSILSTSEFRLFSNYDILYKYLKKKYNIDVDAPRSYNSYLIHNHIHEKWKGTIPLIILRSNLKNTIQIYKPEYGDDGVLLKFYDSSIYEQVVLKLDVSSEYKQSSKHNKSIKFNHDLEKNYKNVPSSSSLSKNPVFPLSIPSFKN